MWHSRDPRRPQKTFTVRLPRLAGAGIAPGATGEIGLETNKAGPLRIQIVDDNIDAAATLATLLELQGHQVSVENDGRSALRRARLDRPQVLLLDIGLPDMDGYELARQIRAMPDTAGAMLVALTGYGQGRDRREAESAGFDHHLVKPASMEQIEDILAQARARLEEAA